MKPSEHEKRNGVIAAVLAIVLIPLLMAVAWPFVVFNARYRACVQLQNGLNLGYAAVFDLSRSFLKPIAVPRLPDGTPLIRDDMWAIYITDTTIYGWALGETSGEDYDYAWRADTGLILKEENPVLYERLITEAGHANWDIDIGSVGTGWLLNELIKRPEFNVHRCPTSLITW